MKANCWVSKNTVQVQCVPDPAILNRRDAIVKVTSTAICGSDLHLLDGYVPTMQRGDVIGHEFMGEVVEVGDGIGPDQLRVGDRVVVRPAAKEEVTESGIVIPDTAKEKPQEGVVVAIGSGKLLENGDRTPLEINEGDRVLCAKYGGTEFKLDGEEYLVLRESDVLAILVKE